MVTQTPVPAQKRCRVSKLHVFIFALSLSYVTKNVAFSYARSMITQIERRFNIPSSLVGVIDSSFDIGNILVITFVSYFGAKLHRPRMISIGCVVMFLGGCITVLPHFIMKRYQYETAKANTLQNVTSHTSHAHLCVAGQSHARDPEFSEDCTAGSSESLMWIFVLVGNILQGCGEVTMEPLGLSYIDDFANVENSPFYIGIVQTLSIGGPLLGSLMGAYFAKLYVDVGYVNLDEVTLSINDTRWVGAWWIGYLATALLNLLAAIPFWFVPKSLPKEGQEEQPELREMLSPQTGDNREGAAENADFSVQEFLILLNGLLRNKVYMLFLLVTFLQFSAFVGFFSFTPKFLEQQYGISASEAIFLIGVTTLPVIGVGYFLGGFFMKRFKITTLMSARFGFCTLITEYLLYLLAFSMTCKNAAVAGLTVSYDGVEQVSYVGNLSADCNMNCGCLSDVWDPVCGDNGVAYVSACLAGCSSSTGSGQNVIFQNCSCVYSSNTTAVLGQCPREERCNTMLVYFMILNVLCCFIFSMGAMPGYMVLIRSLTPEEKSFGLGLHLLLARALGGIPSPIFYGAAIDTTCIKWGTTSCGDPGACRMYDSDAYRYLYFGIPAGLRFVSFIPCILILLSMKRVSSREESARS
ncbi:LOW QUALITY PROTEIN: solute carrier organic anion transporter family member 1A2-like [Pseudophryne corroboree]|uniref:LOW QUALITY PROTEIN: solute carrier organic anion transporter family member 1A2-like n=1 Tax=Pseudophryne corroboree TaxID=495146 RepID=UPI003081A77A